MTVVKMIKSDVKAALNQREKGYKKKIMECKRLQVLSHQTYFDLFEILRGCSIRQDEHCYDILFKIQRLDFWILVGWFVPKLFFNSFQLKILLLLFFKVRYTYYANILEVVIYMIILLIFYEYKIFFIAFSGNNVKGKCSK